MTKVLKKSISSLSVLLTVMAGSAAVGADSLSTESINSEQVRQFAQEQDQTQFKNRQRLENRINGTDQGSHALKKRERKRLMQQNRAGGQAQGRGNARSYGSGSGNSGMGNSGRRMAGSGAGGGRR